ATAEEGMDATSGDLRYAVRALVKSPGFATIAILTLALGVGANTAIFSAVHAILWRPLPYAGSDRLVRFIEHRPPDDMNALGYPRQLASVWTSDLAAVRLQATMLSHIGVYVGAPLMLTGLGGDPIRVHATRLSPAVFAMLGAHTQLGRTFDSQEETPGLDGVVVLSHLTWHR